MTTFRHTLWFRLTAAFLVVALVGIAAVAILANQATATGFRAFLSQNQAAQWRGLVEDLANLYRQQGSFAGAEAFLYSVRPGSGGGRLAVLDDAGREAAAIGGQGRMRGVGAGGETLRLPIEVAGEQVGTLLVQEPGGGAGAGAAAQFLSQVNRSLLWGGLLSAVLAVGLGVLLARRLTRPLSQLTRAARQMAAGERSPDVPADAGGEIGELAASVDQMAAALAAAERGRQQLLADVAHELRTPLSIMRGQVEAMLDGVFEMTPENLALVHEETLLLGRLIDDLRTLSLAESGQLPLHRAHIDATELARQTAVSFQPLADSQNTTLTTDVPAKAPPVWADPDRVQQVLDNLMANALRHVGEGDGAPQITLQARPAGDAIEIRVSDNGPGLSPAAQAHVFDRFWREDRSRTRHKGGSGLGLAISRAIVEAHNGRIWVESDPSSGATFAFTLPIAPDVQQPSLRGAGPVPRPGHYLVGV